MCVFLPRTLKAPQVRRALPASKSKFAHLIQVRHRDEVEAPMTDWLHEAYEFAAPDTPKHELLARRSKAKAKRTPAGKKKKVARKSRQKEVGSPLVSNTSGGVT